MNTSGPFNKQEDNQRLLH